MIASAAIVQPSTGPTGGARSRPARRAGLTLIEVLIALAIFLMAMVVFGGIIVKNGQIARDIRRQNTATRLCQSVLAQAAAGVVPLSSQDGVSFDDEPSYTWSMDAEQGQEQGLWNVTVTVTGPPSDDAPQVQVRLMKIILDPSIIGSTQDVTQPTSSTTTGSSSSSSTSSSPSSASTPAASATTPKSSPSSPGGK